MMYLGFIEIKDKHIFGNFSNLINAIDLLSNPYRQYLNLFG